MLQTWQEFTAGGRPQGGSIPEDLRDFIENVSAVDHPALAMFRRSKVNTLFIEWQEDSLPARGFNAYSEGVAASDQALTTPTRTFTHVQTFARWGLVSDEDRATQHKGLADMFLYQEGKAIQATLNDIEHAIHRGSSATGATNAARQFGGLLNILTTNFTASSGTTLTEEIFGNLLQLFTDGNLNVKPSVCFVNSWLKRTISQYNTKVQREINASERLQTLVVDRYQGDFNAVDIYYSRDQLKGASKTASGNSLVLADPSFFETGWLQPLMSETLARNGLRTHFQVSAMMTLLYRSEKGGGGGTGFVPYIP
jgi:uncharacterized protein DUF5309